MIAPRQLAFDTAVDDYRTPSAGTGIALAGTVCVYLYILHFLCMPLQIFIFML